jgi:hypothetical protein
MPEPMEVFMGDFGGNGKGGVRDMPLRSYCKESGKSPSTVYRQAKRGEIILRKDGRATLVDMEHERKRRDALPLLYPQGGSHD